MDELVLCIHGANHDAYHHVQECKGADHPDSYPNTLPGSGRFSDLVERGQE